MKNSLYFVALLFVSGLTFGQGDTRGVNGVEVTKDSTTIGKIRGVIVGVSKYANLPQGNQLKFADADAESMYEYLSVHQQTDRSNLYLLKNEEVSFQNFKGRFVEAFRHSKEGDVLVIYFAGHGNLQRGDNECFLLLHGIKENDTEYFIDDEAVPLSLLQKYEAQCVAKKIRFLLIIDACHAGKILSETGSNTTAAVLNATWENSLKLISCGPKQLSYEYADLGGGHGVFTYYLLESFKKIGRAHV